MNRVVDKSSAKTFIQFARPCQVFFYARLLLPQLDTEFLCEFLRICKSIDGYAVFKEIPAGDVQRYIFKIIVWIFIAKPKQLEYIFRLNKKRRAGIESKPIPIQNRNFSSGTGILFKHIYLDALHGQSDGNRQPGDPTTNYHCLPALHAAFN